MKLRLEMAWAAKRPANGPLTDLFTSPLTAHAVLFFVSYWAVNEPLIRLNVNKSSRINKPYTGWVLFLG